MITTKTTSFEDRGLLIKEYFNSYEKENKQMGSAAERREAKTSTYVAVFIDREDERKSI